MAWAFRNSQTLVSPPTSSGSGVKGTALVDFGTFPGSSHTTVAVTGQTAITADSIVDAWILPKDTADHSADEHVAEPIEVYAVTPTAGVGFTIHAKYVGEGSTMPYGLFTVAWAWS